VLDKGLLVVCLGCRLSVALRCYLEQVLDCLAVVDLMVFWPHTNMTPFLCLSCQAYFLKLKSVSMAYFLIDSIEPSLMHVKPPSFYIT
jgi:hypothetical protein